MRCCGAGSVRCCRVTDPTQGSRPTRSYRRYGSHPAARELSIIQIMTLPTLEISIKGTSRRNWGSICLMIENVWTETCAVRKILWTVDKNEKKKQKKEQKLGTPFLFCSKMDSTLVSSSLSLKTVGACGSTSRGIWPNTAHSSKTYHSLRENKNRSIVQNQKPERV